MNIQGVEQYYSGPSDAVLNSSEKQNASMQNEVAQPEAKLTKTENQEQQSSHSVDFLV